METAGQQRAAPPDYGAAKPTTMTVPPKSPTPHSQTLEAFKDIAFGSAAGIIGKYIEYPFDTVKVRLQTQPHVLPGQRPLYTGPVDCFRQSITQSGILSLYRGISAPLFGAAIETSSLFLSYRVAQEALQSTILPRDQPLPFQALVVCGAASGAFTSLLLTPIELIKCKMQVPGTPDALGYKTPGPLALIGNVLRHHGLLGLWHGQLGTLIRETGGSAAWFGSYEGVSALFRRFSAAHDTSTFPIDIPPLPIYQQLLAGAAAGISYNFVFYPADTIKSRMQTSDITQLTKDGQMTFWNTGKELWREQGLRGLYRGCGITVGRAAPSSAFIFAVYESLRAYFG